MWNRLSTPRRLGSVHWLLCACLVASLATGCAKRKKEEPAPTPPAPVEPAVPKNIDADLLTALKKASVDCKVIEKQARINCNGGKKNALVLSFNRGERKRIPSLPTFNAALRDGDEKVQALAASVLYAAFRLGLGPDLKPGAIETADAKEFVEAAFALPSAASMQAIPAATHVAMLGGQGDLLMGSLGDDKSIQVRTMAYRYLMVYGRLSVFDKIKTLSEDPGAALVLAAIESPRNMKKWTPEEQKTICPWAIKFLEDPRPPVAGNATAVLSHCAGEDLDTLLNRIERSLKEKRFSFIHSTALRDVCRKSSSRSNSSASEEQCERVRALQEKAVKEESIQPRVRAMTLSSMAHRWPDKQSLKMAKKFEKAKEVEIQRAAQQVAKKLSLRLERESSKAAKSTSAAKTAKPAMAVKPATAVKPVKPATAVKPVPQKPVSSSVLKSTP